MKLWKLTSPYTFKILALVGLVIFGLSACDQWQDLDTDLSISENLVEIIQPANTVTFLVRNSGDDGTGLYFSISEECAWLTVSPTSGETSDEAEITVTVDFTDFSATEVQECELTVTGADKTKNLTVRAQNDMPDCSVSNTSLPFGEVEVGTSSSLQFTITNTGGGTLAGDITQSPPFTVNPTSYSLTSEESQVFTVTFTPQNAIDYDSTIDCDNDCDDVDCTGRGIEEPTECEVIPNHLNFGNVEVGQVEYRTFTITNVGEGVLEGNVDEEYNYFSITEGAGPYELGPDESLEVTVSFSPEINECEPQQCTITTGTPLCQDVTADGEGWAELPLFDWYPGNIVICDDDSECGNASGDGDGLAEPDEHICLRIGLTNIGDGTAYNVTGCIEIWSEDENCYNENNECEWWYDISPGETSNSNWFDFEIPYDADCSELDFDLTIWYYDACHDQEYSQTLPVWMPISYCVTFNV